GEPELDHRAIVLDEPRIRGAAGGRELRTAARHLADGRRDEIDERAGLREKNIAIAPLPLDAPADAVGGSDAEALLDQRAQALAGVAIVVEDIEACTRLGRND